MDNIWIQPLNVYLQSDFDEQIVEMISLVLLLHSMLPLSKHRNCTWNTATRSSFDKLNNVLCLQLFCFVLGKLSPRSDILLLNRTMEFDKIFIRTKAVTACQAWAVYFRKDSNRRNANSYKTDISTCLVRNKNIIRVAKPRKWFKSLPLHCTLARFSSETVWKLLSAEAREVTKLLRLFE